MCVPRDGIHQPRYNKCADAAYDFETQSESGTNMCDMRHKCPGDRRFICQDACSTYVGPLQPKSFVTLDSLCWVLYM